MSAPARQPIPAVQALLLGLVAAWALASLYDSPVPQLTPLQNLPTLAFVVGLALMLRHWPLPTSAVACLAAFLAFHTLGGRYAYSNVPYDDWAMAMGLPTPTGLFGFHRNHYDRLVHFLFGLLMVHPIAATLNRHGKAGSRLSLYVAVEFVLAASAVYEVFEWALTMLLGGNDVETYNGQQGDMWDAQKDMALAGFGAIIGSAMILSHRPHRQV